MQISFPPDLTARQREAIHCLAEKEGLQHKSLGEDRQRHIVVENPNPNRCEVVPFPVLMAPVWLIIQQSLHPSCLSSLFLFLIFMILKSCIDVLFQVANARTTVTEIYLLLPVQKPRNVSIEVSCILLYM